METILNGGFDIEGVLHGMKDLFFMGALGLTGFKTAIAAYKALLGDFKQGREDLRWAFFGLCVLAMSSTIVEGVTDYLFTKM